MHREQMGRSKIGPSRVVNSIILRYRLLRYLPLKFLSFSLKLNVSVLNGKTILQMDRENTGIL